MHNDFKAKCMHTLPMPRKPVAELSAAVSMPRRVCQWDVRPKTRTMAHKDRDMGLKATHLHLSHRTNLKTRTMSCFDLRLDPKLCASLCCGTVSSQSFSQGKPFNSSNRQPHVCEPTFTSRLPTLQQALSGERNAHCKPDLPRMKPFLLANRDLEAKS